MENTANYLFNGQPVKKEFQDISVYSMKIYSLLYSTERQNSSFLVAYCMQIFINITHK